MEPPYWPQGGKHMTKQNLLDLADRVEARNLGLSSAREIGKALGVDYHTHAAAIANLASALNGSLDAVKALHDTVLPGWGSGHEYYTNGEDRGVISWVWPETFWEPDWQLGQDCYRSHPDAAEGCCPAHAAAWVAAILRAKAGEE